jgi:hypothetical protein
MTILTVAMAAAPLPALAEAPVLLDRFYVSADLQSSAVDFGARWDYDDVSRGREVDFGELGLAHITGHLWEAGTTLGGAHRFEAFGWNFDDKGFGRLPNQVVVHGNTIAADTRVNSSLNVNMQGVAYTWFFNRGDRHAFGAGVGAVRYELSSQVDFNVGGFPGSFTIDNHFGEEIDMPMVRAEYVRSFAGKWRFIADASYAHRSSDNAKGRGTEVNAGIEFLPVRHLSLAVRYNQTRVDFDLQGRRPEETSAADPDYWGSMRMRHSGPQLIASLRF